MDLKKAIKVLSTHQKWRKGEKVKPTNPTELTEALDIAVNLLKGLETNKKTK